MVQHIVQDIIDILLERCRSSLEPERRHHGLVQAKTYDECSQLLVAFYHVHSVESGNHIKLHEDLRFADGIQSRFDQQDWVMALHGYVVNTSVVNADMDSTPRLLRQQDWRSSARFRGSDESFCQVII